MSPIEMPYLLLNVDLSHKSSSSNSPQLLLFKLVTAFISRVNSPGMMSYDPLKDLSNGKKTASYGSEIIVLERS
jgi:hypothetical protein